MTPGFSTRLWWECGWKSCMAYSKDWRSENINVIELNCKVVKKVAAPSHFYINPSPLFQHLLSAVTLTRSLAYCNAGGSKICFSISLDILINGALSSAPETNWNKKNCNFVLMDGTTNKFKNRFTKKNQLFIFGKLSWY